MHKVNRRTFLRGAGATLASACGLQACGLSSAHQSSKTLNVFSWADYLPPHAIEDFQSKFGINVVYDTFASNEALLARMGAGSIDYDVIVPSSYVVPKLKQLKLLRQIEKDRVPNRKHLIGRFTNMAYDPDGDYSVAYTFGTTGIAYNAAACRAHAVPPPEDWDVFWDKRFGGRITLLEDVRETLGFVLKKLGAGYNSVDEGMLEKAKMELIRQKPLTMAYTTDQVIVYLGSGDAQLALSYSGDAHQASRWNKDVTYVIPRGGGSLWVDNMCVPAGAPHPENAWLWINYMLDPQVSAALTNYTFYATPNHGALKYVEQAMLDDKTLYPSDAVLDSCDEIKDIGDGIFLYDRMWSELKCV